MPLRPLLNVAYVLALDGIDTDRVDELDESLIAGTPDQKLADIVAIGGEVVR